MRGRGGGSCRRLQVLAFSVGDLENSAASFKCAGGGKGWVAVSLGRGGRFVVSCP